MPSSQPALVVRRARPRRHETISNRPHRQFFVVLGWEKQEEYDELCDSLVAEHKPATPTEQLLVEKMAQHYWLSLRAGLLQELCFSFEHATCDDEKKLALYMRYQTSHERAFHKSLNELLKLRAERRKVEIGFESQDRKQADELSKQEMHEARLRLINAKIAAHHACIPPRVPGPITRPLDRISPERAHEEAA
jgi:hypothetical protein